MERAWSGAGSAMAPKPPEVVRDALLDPARLAASIPGAQSVERLADGRFAARLSFGVGPFRSVYNVELDVLPGAAPFEFTITGSSAGGLGTGRASGVIRLVGQSRGRTAVEWEYAGDVGGPVAMAGNTLLRRTAQIFCARFIDRLIAGL